MLFPFQNSVLPHTAPFRYQTVSHLPLYIFMDRIFNFKIRVVSISIYLVFYHFFVCKEVRFLSSVSDFIMNSTHLLLLKSLPLSHCTLIHLYPAHVIPPFRLTFKSLVTSLPLCHFFSLSFYHE